MKLKAFHKPTGEVRDIIGFYDEECQFEPTSNRIEDMQADMSECILMIGSGINDVNGNEIFSGHVVEFTHKESGHLIRGFVFIDIYMNEWVFSIANRNVWKEDKYWIYPYGPIRLDSIGDAKIIGVKYENRCYCDEGPSGRTVDLDYNQICDRCGKKG